jgi:hypothetical protein
MGTIMGHIDLLHNQLVSAERYPVAIPELDELSGLDNCGAKVNNSLANVGLFS